MRYDTIQVLRGLAATAVVASHMVDATIDEGSNWVLSPFFVSGEIGVDIFFVISGFIIYMASSGTRKKTPMHFLVNRFWRVVPPYWAVLIAYTCAALLLAVVFGDVSKVPSAESFFRSIFLWPMSPTNYVLIVTWTLSLEVIFYALFALTFLRAGPRPFFLAMFVWYLAGLASLALSGDMSGWAYPVLNSVVAEFVLGAGIAHVALTWQTRGHVLAFWIGLVAFFALMAGALEPHGWIRRELLYGLPCALLVYGAVGLQWQWPRTFLLWGESSYLLYLIHLPFMSFVGRGIEELTGFNIYFSDFAAIATVLSAILFSAACTVWLERPYQRWYKRRFLAPSMKVETAV